MWNRGIWANKSDAVLSFDMNPLTPSPPAAVTCAARGEWLALAAITLAGGVLRFVGLGQRDLWFDEGCSFYYVQHLFNWPEGSSLLVESTNLPYYLLLYGWTALFGVSEPALRSLSAAAAALTIPLLWGLARRLCGPLGAAATAVLVALHPLHVYYGHEARAYALWVLLLTVALRLLVEAVLRGGWRWWAAYGAALLICLHLHYFTMYWLPASVACVALSCNPRGALKSWLRTTLGVVVLFVPYLRLAVLPAARGGGSAWIGGGWDPWHALPETLSAFLPAGTYARHLRGLSLLSSDTVVPGSIWLHQLIEFAPPLLLVGVVVAGAWRGRALRVPPIGWPVGDGIRPRRVFLFLGVMVLAPILGALAYSLLVRPHYLPGRYDLVSWPAAMALLGAVISWSARRTWPGRVGWAAGGMTGLLVLCSVLPLSRVMLAPEGTSYARARAQRLAALADDKDLVITLHYDHYAMVYYLHRAGMRARVVSFPSWLGLQVGWVDTRADLAALAQGRVAEDARRLVEEVANTLGVGGRVWLAGDSIDAFGPNRRQAIHQVLVQALHNAGMTGRVVEGNLAVIEIMRQPDGPPSG